MALESAAEAELATPTIAELIEASFVRAVMDLRTGLVDTLKLFVAAVKAGYERAGVPIGAWTTDVAMAAEYVKPVTVESLAAGETSETRTVLYGRDINPLVTRTCGVASGQ